MGIEQADQCRDVLRFPGSLEVADNLALSRRRRTGRLRGSDASARRRRQLAARRRRAANDLRHLGEGILKDVVQDERDPLGGRQRLQHHQKRHRDRLVEGHPLGRVGRTAGMTARPVRVVGQRLGDPLAHVPLPAASRRTEQVEADPAGHRRQPAAGRLDGILLLRGHRVPAGVGLLCDVFRLRQGTEKAIRQVDQLTPFAHDHAQTIVWPGRLRLESFGHALFRSIA